MLLSMRKPTVFEDAGEDIINGAGDAAEDIIDGVTGDNNNEKTTATGR